MDNSQNPHARRTDRGKLAEEFLTRLYHLLRQRREQAEALNQEGSRLVERAIYSTYYDLRDLGEKELADRALHDPSLNPLIRRAEGRRAA